MSLVGEWALRINTDRLLEERTTIAVMAADQINQTLQQAVADLDQAQRMMELSNNLSEVNSPVQILGQNPLFNAGVLLVDATGRIVDTYPPELLQSEYAITELSSIVEGFATQEIRISTPFIRSDNQPITAVSIPLLEDGRYLGMLTGLVDLTSPIIRTPLITAKRVGETGHATLIDSDGITLASTLNIPLLTTNEHPDFYCQAMEQDSPSIGTTPFALQDIVGEHYGEDHVMAVAPMTVVPWGVAVGGDVDETFLGIQQLRRGLLIVSGIALVTIFAATLYSAQKLTHPIRQLTTAAQQIDAGDLDTPMDLPGWGEVGILSTTLEGMRIKLLDNMRSLENWNETLEDKVAAQTNEIRQQNAQIQNLLQHTLTAQENERSRIARELHDEIGQYLTAIEFSMERINQTLPADNEQVVQALEYNRTLLEKTVASLRRIITNMRPGVLDELGLIASFSWMGKHILEPANIQFELKTDGVNGRLPAPLETALFRIAQEAINNVVKHSQATRLTITLEQEENGLSMTLADDGRGFDQTAVSPDPDAGNGYGLPGMRERAAAIGGEVHIESNLGEGTTIKVHIPFHEKR